MATATVNQQQQSQPQLIKTPARIVPIKVGSMGEQGAGKTTTNGLLAAALSKEFHGGAPVHVTDPELGWQFLRPRIFAPEKIQLVQRTVPTFKAMLEDIAFAEREGACVWAVELGKIWTEILKSLQRAKPDNWGSELSYMWVDFVNRFLSSKLHCLVLGRIQDIMEDVITESGNIKSIKSGEGLKAGGQKNNFGYEPHLVIRMNIEQRPRVKRGKTFEEEGRMIHRAKVTKDRTWALNGKVFRWMDRDTYRPGDYKYVWNDLRPHFLAVQETEGIVLDTSASSESMFNADGNSEYWQKKQRKEVLSAELHASMDYLWGGTAQAAKLMRMKVFEHIFGFKSKDAADAASLDKIERGVRILQAFEKRCKTDAQIMKGTDEEILQTIDAVITEYDKGEADTEDLPF